MKKKVIAILFTLLYISIPLFSDVKNGFVDLSDYIFDDETIIDLSGEWILKTDNSESIVIVPDKSPPNKNFVTYIIKIYIDRSEHLMLTPVFINSLYKIYHNEKLLVENNQNRPIYTPITLEPGENLVELQMYTPDDKLGGFRKTPKIGGFNAVLQKYELNILRDTIISGSSLIIFLFFIVLYLNYRSEKYTHYFALICFFLSIRGLVVNDKLIFNYIPTLSFFIVSKLEYLSSYPLPALVLAFLYFYYIDEKKYQKVIKGFIIVGVLFPLSIIFPSVVFMNILYPFYIYMVIVILLIFIVMINYIIKKVPDAKRITFSILALAIAGVVDSLITVYHILDFYILPSAMIFFIVMMSVIVSQREIRNQKNLIKISADNQNVIKYLSKFVPNSFIKAAGFDSLLDIKRSDGVERTMTVVFSTITDFQSSMKLTEGEKVIDKLNRCFSIIGPIIMKHGGFIDKFIDETVMSLFPGTPDNALDAVIEINQTLIEYNKKEKSTSPLKMRSGIHRGSLFIGIVGDNNRYDATVISNVVNTASRINSFNSKLDRDILVSEDFLNSMENIDKYKNFYMGRVKLKGKSNYIGIRCIYWDRIEEADNLFSITMKKLENSSLYDIENVLFSIKGMHPNHKPTLYYLDLIRENKKLEDLNK